MNKTIAICSLLAWTVVWLCVTTAAPQWLGDTNKFMKSFLEHDFLGFMGVVVTITLASSSNLFIELNKLEEKIGRISFPNTKTHVKHSSFSLIAALVASVILSVMKPIVDSGERAQAFVNGFSILVVIFSILILIDLTMAAFDLEPPIIPEGKTPPQDS